MEDNYNFNFDPAFEVAVPPFDPKSPTRSFKAWTAPRSSSRRNRNPAPSLCLLKRSATNPPPPSAAFNCCPKTSGASTRWLTMRSRNVSDSINGLIGAPYGSTRL
ncbi:hypothetical protein A4X09_0g7809 [Tilletia walkeri]|uniref:Uncharacterized protein n=1 Tax=Tilletia walkeri TaxID=117179 RepID=A0A8X7T1Q2_9BASI|nr:hypothetical protein A4X09_0g7809 [Tilletia walkeri]